MNTLTDNNSTGNNNTGSSNNNISGGANSCTDDPHRSHQVTAGTTGASPRSTQDFFEMANSNTSSDMTNVTAGSGSASQQQGQGPLKGREDSIPRTGRQDSMSFYTNMGANGQRFSTNSNSSISNFLSFVGQDGQPVYESNGRGLSVINNMFLPPQQAPSTSQGQGTGAFPPQNDFNAYSTLRRPSEQLEPFNPSVKLKVPSFSKKGSVVYPSGTSFSEGDFDIFFKKDNNRRASFLNNLGEGSDFDLFAKRDSLKNIGDVELDLKDVKAEPGATAKAQQMKSIPENASSSSDRARPSAILPQQQQNEQQQHLPQQQPEFRAPQFDYNPRFNEKTQVSQQHHIEQPHLPPPRSLHLQPHQQQQDQQQYQVSPLDRDPPARLSSPLVAEASARRNALQTYHDKHTPDQMTSPQDASNFNTDHPKLISAQETAMREDGRPLLGATKVDQLMLVIQARKKGIHQQIPQASDGSILDNGAGILPQQTELVGGIDKPKTKSAKQHECSYCHKTFTQSTHLEVHVRSHIGFKPFVCAFCGKRFTQGGNLRTHERLHTGEKPYRCGTCGRQFSRKGNLAAHHLTHGDLRPFECKLDGCNKAFTQLGNLKAHQNRFHLNTLNELTKKLAELDPTDSDIKPEERELLNYFATLYKNSNRGIKGRGKKVSGSDIASGTPMQQSQIHHTTNGHHYSAIEASSSSGDTTYNDFNPDYQLGGSSGSPGSKNIEFKNVNYQR